MVCILENFSQTKGKKPTLIGGECFVEFDIGLQQYTVMKTFFFQQGHLFEEKCNFSEGVSVKKLDMFSTHLNSLTFIVDIDATLTRPTKWCCQT